jgi:hypothetical protein
VARGFFRIFAKEPVLYFSHRLLRSLGEMRECMEMEKLMFRGYVERGVELLKQRKQNLENGKEKPLTVEKKLENSLPFGNNFVFLQRTFR